MVNGAPFPELWHTGGKEERMKEKKIPEILLLGTGYLAEYLIPCYRKVLGDLLPEHMTGIKGSRQGLEERRKIFPFPVQVLGTQQVLEQKRPDLILLAVKPEQVDSIVRSQLLPYYEKCRAEGRSLPVLYSFAPDPPVDYFYNVLGEDILEANLLPNMIDEINGVHVAETGVSFVSFRHGHPWPEEKRQEALDFLKPTGTVVETAGEKAVDLLAVKVASHVMYEFNYIFHERMEKRGIPMPYSSSAGTMREIHHGYYTGPGTELLPWGGNPADTACLPFLQILIASWYDGIVEYARTAGIPEETAARMAGGTMEIHLMTVQHSSREKLEQNTRNHATKGGVLEKCILTFQEKGWALVQNGLEAYLSGSLPSDFAGRVQETAVCVTRAVAEHGRTLGGLTESGW